MKYTYTVGEQNFLNFQLYHISQTDGYKSKLRRQPLFIMLLNIALSAYFFAEKNYIVGSIFIVIGILWFILYPNRIRRMYHAKFENEIQSKYANQFGHTAQLEISDEYLKTTDKGGSSEKRYSEILRIIHLPEETLVIFKNKQTFILPKATTENYTQMVADLNEKANRKAIKILELPNWKW